MGFIEHMIALEMHEIPPLRKLCGALDCAIELQEAFPWARPFEFRKLSARFLFEFLDKHQTGDASFDHLPVPSTVHAGPGWIAGGCQSVRAGLSY